MGRIKSLSRRAPSSGNIDWNKVVKRAQEVVESYDTMVTLRQLYYRLISDPSLSLPNKQSIYKTLSAKTAQARREGWFPPLIDRTRSIEAYAHWASPRARMDEAVASYRRDRTEGQQWSIYLGVEKHGMSTQLMHWFGDYGIPILALGGYSSQTFVDEVREDVIRQGRPSVLLYAGDFDPSGVDIDRDFIERGNCFDRVVRVALTKKLIDKHDLPPMPGKHEDSRSARFMMEHGDLIQVELDALPPNFLRGLYEREIKRHFDFVTWEASVESERQEREFLKAVGQIISDPREAIVKLVSSGHLAEDQIDEISDAVADVRLG